MSEYKKDYYGGSSLYNHDVTLSASSRNFEFRYTCPDQLDRAILKYHEQRASELTSANASKSHNAMPKFCKIKHGGHDVVDMYTSHDQDVETVISSQHHRPVNMRALSTNEIQRLIEQSNVKENNPKNEKKLETAAAVVNESEDIYITLAAAEVKDDDEEEDFINELSEIEAMHREVCEELERVKGSNVDMTVQTLERTASLAAFVATHDGTNRSNNLSDNPNREYMTVSYEDYPQPQAKWVEVVHSAELSQKINVELCKPMDASLMYAASESVAYEFMTAHADNYQSGDSVLDIDGYDDGTIENETAPGGAYYVDDSDLEYEMAARPKYAKYYQSKPERFNEGEDGDSDMPLFVEMEKMPAMNLSFLKNTAPMRYSEMTEKLSEDDAKQSKYGKNRSDIHNQIRVIEPMKAIKVQKSNKKRALQLKKKDQVPVPNTSPMEMSPEQTIARKGVANELIADSAPTERGGTKGSQKKTRSIKQKAVSNASNQAAGMPTLSTPTQSSKKQTSRQKQISARQTQQSLTSSKGEMAAKPNNSKVDAPGSQSGRAKPLRQMAGKDSVRKSKTVKVLACTKSIEDLKMEKLSIYNKMALTQERIIQALDRLRCSLLQIQIPDCCYEKSKRQRNAFEFCVRFSRNFLYPLKGMIDDFRFMSPDAFHSAISNDGCYRVSAIYSLIYQSLHTYQRQLRYFLLDQVPQKLSALIEMIYTMTTICLEKGLFDRQDTIIECMQERCSKFIVFIEDMQEERFMQERENFRRQAEKQNKLNQSHSHYNLKMCMNDMNMYEPKLVRKCQPPRSKRILRKPQRKSAQQQSTQGQQSQISEPDSVLPPEEVKTHIEDFRDDCSQITVPSNRGCLRECHGLQHRMTSYDYNMFNELPTTSFAATAAAAAAAAGQHHHRMEVAKKEDIDDSNDLNPLNAALIEALQMVTKQQVRQVLEPIIQSLGSMLDKKEETPQVGNPALNEPAKRAKKKSNTAFTETALNTQAAPLAAQLTSTRIEPTTTTTQDTKSRSMVEASTTASAATDRKTTRKQQTKVSGDGNKPVKTSNIKVATFSRDLHDRCGAKCALETVEMGSKRHGPSMSNSKVESFDNEDMPQSSSKRGNNNNAKHRVMSEAQQQRGSILNVPKDNNNNSHEYLNTCSNSSKTSLLSLELIDIEDGLGSSNDSNNHMNSANNLKTDASCASAVDTNRWPSEQMRSSRSHSGRTTLAMLEQSLREYKSEIPTVQRPSYSTIYGSNSTRPMKKYTSVASVYSRQNMLDQSRKLQQQCEEYRHDQQHKEQQQQRSAITAKKRLPKQQTDAKPTIKPRTNKTTAMRLQQTRHSKVATQSPDPKSPKHPFAPTSSALSLAPINKTMTKIRSGDSGLSIYHHSCMHANDTPETVNKFSRWTKPMPKCIMTSNAYEGSDSGIACGGSRYAINEMNRQARFAGGDVLSKLVEYDEDDDDEIHSDIRNQDVSTKMMASNEMNFEIPLTTTCSTMAIDHLAILTAALNKAKCGKDAFKMRDECIGGDGGDECNSTAAKLDDNSHLQLSPGTSPYNDAALNANYKGLQKQHSKRQCNNPKYERMHNDQLLLQQLEEKIYRNEQDILKHEDLRQTTLKMEQRLKVNQVWQHEGLNQLQEEEDLQQDNDRELQQQKQMNVKKMQQQKQQTQLMIEERASTSKQDWQQQQQQQLWQQQQQTIVDEQCLQQHQQESAKSSKRKGHVRFMGIAEESDNSANDCHTTEIDSSVQQQQQQHQQQQQENRMQLLKTKEIKQLKEMQMSQKLLEQLEEHHANNTITKKQTIDNNISNKAMKTNSDSQATQVRHAENAEDHKANTKSSKYDNEDETSDVKYLRGLLEQRKKFSQTCETSFFYNNPIYPDPWRVFAGFADNLSTEIAEEVENDFSNGVSQFVEHFLEAETQM